MSSSGGWDGSLALPSRETRSSAGWAAELSAHRGSVLPLNFLWPRLDAPPPIEAGTVHIWAYSLDLAAAPAKTAWHLLSMDERTRADAFRFLHHRLKFIASRACVRLILSAYTGAPPHHIAFATRRGGKPYLVGGEMPHCSWTNSGGLGLCAVGYGYEVGVDAEEVSRVRDPVEIAERFFAPAELAALREALPEARADIFARLWTRKEAYLKALGLGLSVELDRFDVATRPGWAVPLFPPLRRSHDPCWLHDLDACAGYAAALAGRGGSPVGVKAWRWPAEDLLARL